MTKRHPISDTQVTAFLKHYKWLLQGKPRERLAYRIIERQREEIAWLRTQLDAMKGSQSEGRTWTDRVGSDR